MYQRLGEGHFSRFAAPMRGLVCTAAQWAAELCPLLVHMQSYAASDHRKVSILSA